MNFSNMSPSHKLQFFTSCSSMRLFHRVQSLQELSAPVWISHRVISPASKPASQWASLSLGSQVMPGICSSVGFPRGCSCLQESTCTAVVSSMVCRTSMGYGGTAASPWSVPGATGKSLLQYTPPAPPSPLTLMPAKVFFSRILTPFYCCCSAGFFSLFKHIVPEELSSHWVQPWPLVSSSWSHLVLDLLDVGKASGRFSKKSSL